MEGKEGTRYIPLWELAEIMGVGERAAQEIVKQDGFPSFPIGKNRYIIPRAAFEAWWQDPGQITAYKRAHENAR